MVSAAFVLFLSACGSGGDSQPISEPHSESLVEMPPAAAIPVTESTGIPPTQIELIVQPEEVTTDVPEDVTEEQPEPIDLVVQPEEITTDVPEDVTQEQAEPDIGQAVGPLAAIIDLEVGLRMISVTWSDVNEATHYRLLEKEGDLSGWSIIDGRIPNGIQKIEFDFESNLSLVNTSYILQTCIDDLCTDSHEIMAIGALVESVQYFKGPGVTHSYLGSSVAVSSDGNTIAALSSDTTSSYVHIYTLENNEWEHQHSLHGNRYYGSEISDYTAVKISDNGDTVAIMDPSETSVYKYGAGYNKDKWVRAGTLPAATDSAMSGSGEVIAIYNEHTYDHGFGVFEYKDSEWILTSTQHVTTDFSGTLSTLTSMDIDYIGSTIALGSPLGWGMEFEGLTQDGVVFVFSKDSSDEWSVEETLTMDGSGSYFGASVDISGDGETLAVVASHVYQYPALFEEDSSKLSGGGLYMFSRDSGGWNQTEMLMPPVSWSSFFFPAIALNGDGTRLVLGDVLDQTRYRGYIQYDFDSMLDTVTLPKSGGAHVYSLGLQGWEYSVSLKAPNTDSADLFGSSVAISSDGNTIVIGAPGESSNATGVNGNKENDGMPEAGAVYVY